MWKQIEQVPEAGGSGVLADLFAGAVKAVFEGGGFGRAGDGHEDEADGFIGGSAAGAGDAGEGNGPVGAASASGAFGHGAGGFGADGDRKSVV